MIRERLELQQRELQQKKSEHYLPREIELPQTPLVRVILGPRRAGKSTFAMHALPEKFAYAIFDDIQNLPKWELFANRLHRIGKKLVITGSNAHLLSKELATHLTGRHQQLVLFPFSFSETLGSEKNKLIPSEIAAKLDSYIINGGYPEPFLQKTNPKEYLSSLFTSIIFKDIIKRYHIRNPTAMENLAVYLL